MKLVLLQTVPQFFPMKKKPPKTEEPTPDRCTQQSPILEGWSRLVPGEGSLSPKALWDQNVPPVVWQNRLVFGIYTMFFKGGVYTVSHFSTGCFFLWLMFWKILPFKMQKLQDFNRRICRQCHKFHGRSLQPWSYHGCFLPKISVRRPGSSKIINKHDFSGFMWRIITSYREIA